MALIGGLPSLDFSLGGFLPGTGSGVTWPPRTGGLEIGLPGLTIGGGNSPTPTNQPPTVQNAGVLDWFTSIFGPSLLRIVLLILGFICVIGAIYLFKPVNEVVNTALGVPKLPGKNDLKQVVTAVKAAA